MSQWLSQWAEFRTSVAPRLASLLSFNIMTMIINSSMMTHQFIIHQFVIIKSSMMAHNSRSWPSSIYPGRVMTQCSRRHDAKNCAGRRWTLLGEILLVVVNQSIQQSISPISFGIPFYTGGWPNQSTSRQSRDQGGKTSKVGTLQPLKITSF